MTSPGISLVAMIKGGSNPLRRVGVNLSIRYASTVASTSSESMDGSLAQGLSQKELREKAIAEALAREEEAAAKIKAIREMKAQSRININTLNKTPVHLVNSRLAKLQKDLDSIPNQDKVKQLDEELESFMLEHMKLPPAATHNRPWAKVGSDPTVSGIYSETKDDTSVQKIRSTSTGIYTNEFPNLKPTPDYRPYSDQELYLRQLAHTRQSGNLGSKVSNVYKAKYDVLKPKDIGETSIATLLAAGCHFGHSRAMWRPSTQPFIYGEYDGIHLIDLNHTMVNLKTASLVIKGVARKGGIILYVGTSKNLEQERALEEAAKRSKGFYISKRWIPGTITNFTEVTKQIGGEYKVELDMGDVSTNRSFSASQDRELIKPDLVVLVNPVDNRNCINECIKLRIPTIGLCDTNMEPSLLTYPIPCNDDSSRATSLMLGILSKAAQTGMEERITAFKSYTKAKSSALGASSA